MEKAGTCLLSCAIIVAALIVGLVGCAPVGDPGEGGSAEDLAAQELPETELQTMPAAEPDRAAEVGAAESRRMFQRAEAAYDARDYERAQETYGGLGGCLDDLSDDQRAAVRTRLIRIESILYQRRVEEQRRLATAKAVAELEKLQAGPQAAAEPTVRPPAETAESLKSPAPQTPPVEVLPAEGEPSRERPAAPEAESEAEAPPVDVEAAGQRASELLAETASHCAEHDFVGAVPLAVELDPLRQFLAPAARLEYDEFRRQVQQATGRLPDLTSEQRLAMAEEHFEAGLEAYDDEDFALAGRRLEAASAFDVSLGWWDDRKLRSVRQEVEEARRKFDADLQEARRLLQSQSCAEARALLESKRTDSRFGPEPARQAADLLAQIEREEQEQERRALEEQKARAASLLATARDCCARQDFGGAEAPLATLKGRLAHLSPEQQAEYDALLDAVEAATGVRPGLTDRERERKAEEHFAAGIAAHEQRNYVAAERRLDKAAALNVDLGWWDNRKLRSVRAEVKATLARLDAGYQEGRRLFESQNYAEARDALLRVQQADVDVDEQTARQVRELIAEIDAKLAEQERRILEERKAAAALLLVTARDLCVLERFGEAGVPLTSLQGFARYLSTEQRAEYGKLVGQVETATGIRPGMSPEEKARKAEQYFRSGRAARGRGDYFQAKEHLGRAAALDAEVRCLDRSELAAAQAAVNAELKRRRGAFEAGKASYEKGNYIAAKEALSRTIAGDVTVGREIEQNARRMLKGIDRKIEEQKIIRALEAEREGAELARRGGELIRVQKTIHARLRQAMAARDRQDYEAAKSLLAEAQKLLQEPAIAQIPALESTARQVRQVLADVEAKTRREAERQGRRQDLDRLINEACAMAPGDLLQAEKTAYAAMTSAEKEGFLLTTGQQQMLDDILAAAGARYGAERRIQRGQYERLVEFGQQYVASGEYARARHVFAVAADAAPKQIGAEVRKAARDKLAAVERELAAQKKAAAQIAGHFGSVWEALRRGEIEAALKVHELTLSNIRQAELTAPLRIRLLERAIALLETEFEQAVAALQPDLRQAVDLRLAVAHRSVAHQLSNYYLAGGSPELAEPYLRRLGAEAPQYARWARGELEHIEQKKEAAEKERMRALVEQVMHVRDLAREFDTLARAGRLDDAARAERKWAEACLGLRLDKAQDAVARGGHSRAAELLKGAPVEQAGPETVERRFRPLMAQIESYLAAEAKLEAAEAALGECDLSTAAAALNEAHAAGLDARALTVRTEALTAVLDSLRKIQVRQNELRAEIARVLEESRADLGQVRFRQNAWELYAGAIDALLAGQTDEAEQRLTKALADPGGLTNAELANARGILFTFGEREALAAKAEAEKVLADAEAQFASRDYVRADELLRRLRDMPGFAASEELRRQADSLARRILNVEKQAQDLYEQAIRAREAGEGEQLRSLLLELRKRYKGTRTYKEHM